VYSIDEADMTRIAKIRERSKAHRSQVRHQADVHCRFSLRGACVEGLRAFSDRQLRQPTDDDGPAPRN